jgi:dephospho-CoA kinase
VTTTPDVSLTLSSGLSFTVASPLVTEWGYYANRLLRPKLPLPDAFAVYRRFLHRHTKNPQLSHKQLEALSPLLLEQGFYGLAHQLLGHPTQTDSLLSALLASRYSSLFKPQALFEHTLQQLNQTLPGQACNDEAHPDLTATAKVQVLDTIRRLDCLCRWPFVDPPNPITDCYLTFLLNRADQWIFPWTSLLKQLTQAGGLTTHAELLIVDQALTLLGTSSGGGDLTQSLYKAYQTVDTDLFNQQAQVFWRQVALVYPPASLPTALVLVEGNTEAIVLPAIANALGHQWQAKGIRLHGVGGKNAMAGWVQTLRHTIPYPLRVVLDKDAETLLSALMPLLRPALDHLMLIPEGDIEDVLPLPWVVAAVNTLLQPFPPLTLTAYLAQWSAIPQRGEQLKQCFNHYGNTSFDKVALANAIVEVLETNEQAQEVPLGHTLEHLLAVLSPVAKAPSSFKRIGLTGGIASGKSTVGKWLEAKGIPVLDTDAVVHHLLDNDRELRQQLRDFFGQQVFEATGGKVNRQALGALVFANASHRRLLEGWIHPKVRAKVLRFFDSCKAEWQAFSTQRPPLAVAMIPLLFESGLTWLVDDSWLVLTTPEQQLHRLTTTRGLTLDEAQARINSQWPQCDKQALSTICLDNSGTLDQLKTILSTIVA